MEYEYALCLKDAGKRDEAKKIFTKLAETPTLTQALNSQWRLAQLDREPLTSAIDTAKLKIRRARRPADADAARKELATATDAMRNWIQADMPAAMVTLDRSINGPKYVDSKTGKFSEQDRLMRADAEEGRSRLWYEYAWAIRALEDAAADLNEPFQPVNIASTPMDSAHAFRLATESGSTGNIAARDLANIAGLELGEMLAQRGKYDDAMDAFTSVLYNSGGSYTHLRDVGRAKLRIAQCLLSKGDLQAAICMAESINRNMGSRYVGQARYVIGEAYLQLKDFKHAADALRVFQDERNYLASTDVADKALLRLGEVLEQRRSYGEAVLAYEMLLKKFPRSPVADDARAKLIAAKYSWGGIMSRPRSAM